MYTSIVVVGTTALVTAAITLYSGFGLGTVLMPVFALFFPVEMAVAATAMVHGANNLFKVAMVGRHADRSLVLRFGLAAIPAAFAGAAALGYVAGFGQLAVYQLGPRTAVITPLKLVMATLMIVFALFELLPKLRKLRFGRSFLFLGGLLSGFFGGLSGHRLTQATAPENLPARPQPFARSPVVPGWAFLGGFLLCPVIHRLGHTR